MNCETVQHGVVAIPADVFWPAFLALILAALIELGFRAHEYLNG